MCDRTTGCTPRTGLVLILITWISARHVSHLPFPSPNALTLLPLATALNIHPSTRAQPRAASARAPAPRCARILVHCVPRARHSRKPLECYSQAHVQAQGQAQQPRVCSPAVIGERSASWRGRRVNKTRTSSSIAASSLRTRSAVSRVFADFPSLGNLPSLFAFSTALLPSLPSSQPVSGRLLAFCLLSHVIGIWGIYHSVRTTSTGFDLYVDQTHVHGPHSRPEPKH